MPQRRNNRRQPRSFDRMQRNTLDNAAQRQFGMNPSMSMAQPDQGMGQPNQGIGLLEQDPQQQQRDNSLMGMVERGYTNLTEDPRKMAGLSGMAQGLLQAGAVSERPISNAEAMAMASKGANQRTQQFDQGRRADMELQLTASELSRAGRGGTEVQSSDVLADGTTIYAMKDGSRIVRGPNGEVVEGDQARQVIRQAREQGAEWQGMRAGEREGNKISQRKSEEYFDKLNSAQSKMGMYDRAIEALDEGAITGAIEDKFPSMRQSTQKLKDVQRQLGLQVLGETAFGNLSNAEREFALQAALPTDLPPEVLKEELKRKKRLQQKMAQEMERAVIFLGKPGNTLADWARRNQEEKEADQETAGDQQSSGGSQSQASQPSSQQGGGQQPGGSSGQPAPGTIEDGHRFRGGDPSNPDNWERVNG